jgi:ABC-type multidrug transport system fused ATPase/permease subunit
MLTKIYLRLLAFTKPYMKQVAFVWLIVAAAAGLTMIQPKLLQWAVDTGLKPQGTTTLSADVQPAVTTLTVKSAAGFQSDDTLLIKKEKVLITGVDGNNLTVQRGAQGTTAGVLTSGTRVANAKQAFGGKTNTLLLAAILIIAAAAARGFCTYWQTFMGEWLGQHVAFDLRNKIYEKLQRLSYAYHDKQQTGQLMSRATQDVEATRMFIQMGALRLLDMFLRIGFAAFFMFTTDWKLAILSWTLLPLVAWRSIVVNLQMRKIWTVVQEQLGRTTTVLQENLVGVRVVKAFSREDFEEEKFNVEATELFKWNYMQNRLQATNTPFYSAMGMLSQVLVLFVGATWMTHSSVLGVSDNLTAGELTGFLAYLTLLLMPMRMLGFVVSQFSRAGAAGERVFEILDAESAVKEKPDAVVLGNIQGHVRYDHVSFGYDAISPVLYQVNIDGTPGKVVALLGPTGCGKTTVVNLLPRFYDVTGGAITIDGIDIRDMSLQSLRKNIGIIQQDVFLFSATIRDNIAYGAVDATYEQIIEAAKIARIHDYIMSLPDGYDTWVGERGITLSGGQKQRVSIARTLLLDPKILILDDSTSSVDTQTEYLIQQALSAVMRGRTTLVIAQRLRTIKNADEILVMQNGKIVEQGTHEELILQEGLYRQIYDLELRDQEEALKGMAAAAATIAEEPAGPGSGA